MGRLWKRPIWSYSNWHRSPVRVTVYKHFCPGSYLRCMKHLRRTLMKNMSIPPLMCVSYWNDFTNDLSELGILCLNVKQHLRHHHGYITSISLRIVDRFRDCRACLGAGSLVFQSSFFLLSTTDCSMYHPCNRSRKPLRFPQALI